MTHPLSFSPSWPSLSTFTRAFFELSYPTATPANPDSFPTSRYYEPGLLDACFIVSSIAVFAVIRDIVRLHIATPMANKWLFGSTKGAVALTYNKRRGKSLANGNGHTLNGNGDGHYSVHLSAKNRMRERNVVRFAEQSWSLVYYTLWWSFGVVRSFPHLLLPTLTFSSHTSIFT
jgi:acyl-CoA-dependent ceramide synthase